MSAPTLLVGLGGTGSDIVRKVYDHATEAQRANISFVIFDTDVNELKAISDATPAIHTIQTSAKTTVGEYLNHDTYAKEAWFPVSRVLNGKALTEGAGQVRAISRLALNTAVQQGKMEPLEEAIRELYRLKGQKTEQVPRVIITGSLAGGTGSGLVLPVSLYIRNYMTAKLQQGSAIIRGFFLLPEVFEEVIKAPSERNNLYSNAYAAVRELDAFMMKADGTLPEEYKDLALYIPRVGSDELDDISGRPMDFCFLFDAQNLKGMTLKSFEQYKDHAANCIYGMAIAPTSKRSNSSEDNVIREIVGKEGRNRFAGAGTSMLIYPTDEVRKYLALRWTRETISNEWLEIDRKYKDQQRTNKQMRSQGYQAGDIERGEHYIAQIDQGTSEKNPFEMNVRRLCFTYESNGYVEKYKNWKVFQQELRKHIQQQIQAEKSKIDGMLERLSTQAGVCDGDEAKQSDFEDWYTQLLGYKSATIMCTEGLGRNIAYNLFRDNKDFTKTDVKYRIEYWLRTDGNKNAFIHPNGVRLFLYYTIADLTKLAKQMRTQVSETDDYWSTFEEDTFDDKNTDGIIERAEDFYGKAHLDDSGINRLMHRKDRKEAQGLLRAAFGTLTTSIDDYWEQYVSQVVYEEAVKYLQSLAQAFERFYDVLERSIPGISRQISQLEKKYEIREGVALRYVCADEECLLGLGEEVVNTGSTLDLPSELNSSIFNQMRTFALSEKKPSEEAYFSEVFRSTVVGYLEKQIMSQYESVVDMDIISALKKEAAIKNPDISLNTEGQLLYAKNVIESTEILANPFIESPLGREPRIIPSCAYNPSLAESDEEDRTAFINECLRDGGGVDDESIDRNMILFYQAVYDIRANELSKFAPPRKTETSEHPAGDYYKAYHELIRQIHPKTERSKAITPHIDRLWHVISRLPEIDEEVQTQEMKNIHSAFFWGLVGKYVQMRHVNEAAVEYYADRVRIQLTRSGADETLYVSNGTPCDHLYEVLDSFTIYPKLVNAVLEKTDEMVQNDLLRKVALEDSFLFRMLEDFSLQEFENLDQPAERRVVRRSALELPLLMKRSVPMEDYHEEHVISMFETILEVIKDYIPRFTDEKYFPTVYAGLLKEQLELLFENIHKEQIPAKELFEDRLFTYLCDCVVREVEEQGLLTMGREIRQQIQALKAEI